MKRLPLLPTLLVGLAAAAMVGLGIWQLQRARWKDDLIARREAALRLPPIAYPSAALIGDPPLYRHAVGNCLEPVSRRSVAGRNSRGQSGFAIIVDCRTGIDGPGMSVEIGWSLDPNAGQGWRGGEVRGLIIPDRQRRLRLVADEGLAGLQRSVPPGPADIPDNHFFYAVQWFVFAGLAVLIYALALRRRWREKQP